MAGFNVKYLQELMGKIQKGEEIIASVNAMRVLNIPLSAATEFGVIETIKRLCPYGPMREPCSEILKKLQVKQEAEEMKQAKEQAKKERRKENRKRRSAETSPEPTAKRVKSSDEKENEGERKKVTPPKKEPKKQHTTLFKKCMQMRKCINVC